MEDINFLTRTAEIALEEVNQWFFPFAVLSVKHLGLMRSLQITLCSSLTGEEEQDGSALLSTAAATAAHQNLMTHFFFFLP